MHYFHPNNRAMVLAALKKAGREDLIGWEKDCLITPYERKTKTGDKKTASGGKNAKVSPKNGKEAREERRQRPPKHPTKGGGHRKPTEDHRKSH